MISKTTFTNLRNELNSYDKQREQLIIKSRQLLKASKHVIYEIHRGNTNQSLFNNIKKEKAALDKIAKQNPNLFNEGSYSDAVQEYCEAASYFSFIKKKSLPTPKTLNISTGDYLMGLCDLTGELSRKAVSLATKRKYKEVERIKDFVEQLYGEFIHFDFRNSNLRKKYDSIKWNLKKLEEIMYDIHHPSKR